MRFDTFANVDIKELIDTKIFSRRQVNIILLVASQKYANKADTQLFVDEIIHQRLKLTQDEGKHLNINM